MKRQPASHAFPPPAEFSSCLRFRFSGQVKSIRIAVTKVMQFVEANWPAGAVREVELSVQEAFANAVLHGCRSDPAKWVDCLVACDAVLGLLIVVRDTGPGFDTGSGINPDLFAEHGRGLRLIREFMDEVRFAQGGAEIQMRKFPAIGCC
jgi:anti-sigma regulatory factor (Ser/Thr protein kinase)